MKPLPVGRGAYRYRCNGTTAEVEENWENRLENGQLHVRSQRLAHSAGIRLEVSSIQQASQFRECNIVWSSDSAERQLTIAAHYDFQPDRTVIQVDGPQGTLHFEEPAEDSLFAPLMRIYTGQLITGLVEAGGSARVLVPWIRSPQDIERLLTPDYSDRQTDAGKPTVLHLDGQDLPCREFNYHGGEYQPGTRFWVDDAGVLLRYCWQQDPETFWEVDLVDYKPG